MIGASFASLATCEFVELPTPTSLLAIGEHDLTERPGKRASGSRAPRASRGSGPARTGTPSRRRTTPIPAAVTHPTETARPAPNTSRSGETPRLIQLSREIPSSRRTRCLDSGPRRKPEGSINARTHPPRCDRVRQTADTPPCRGSDPAHAHEYRYRARYYTMVGNVREPKPRGLWPWLLSAGVPLLACGSAHSRFVTRIGAAGDDSWRVTSARSRKF